MSNMREELEEFATAMQIVLRENSHKGDGTSVEHGIERMWLEMRELDRAAWGHPNIASSEAQLKAIQKECIDVANFAMMVWNAIERIKKDK